MSLLNRVLDAYIMPAKGKGRKRKADEDVCTSALKREQICILDYENSNCESFTYLSDTKNPNYRLQHLKDIRDLRLSKPQGSVHRMESVCNGIPTDLRDNLDYHRDCYQHFTKNVDRLSRESEPVAGASGLCIKQSRLLKTAFFAIKKVQLQLKSLVRGQLNVHKNSSLTHGKRW